MPLHPPPPLPLPVVNGDYLVSKYPAGSLTTLSAKFVWLYCFWLETISHGESLKPAAGDADGAVAASGAIEGRARS